MSETEIERERGCSGYSVNYEQNKYFYTTHVAQITLLKEYTSVASPQLQVAIQGYLI